MSHIPQTVARVAQMGANIEITAAAGFIPQTVEQVIQIVVGHGGRITVEAGNYIPSSLERFVQIGGNNLTIRF